MTKFCEVCQREFTEQHKPHKNSATTCEECYKLPAGRREAMRAVNKAIQHDANKNSIKGGDSKHGKEL